MRVPINSCSYTGRAIALGALMCLGTLAVSSAQASIIVQDGFGGDAGPVDSAKWAAPSEYGLPSSWIQAPLDGSGHANLNLASNEPRLLAAKSSFFTAPTATDPLRLTMTVADATSQFTFGFSDWGTHVLELRNDSALGGIAGHWSIYMSSNWTSSFDMLDTGVTAASGTWVFNWTPTRVTLLLDNTLVFDSAVNAPTHDDGPAGWQIPTAAMGPMAYTYGPPPAGLGQVDSVLFETVPVPEPAALGLLSLASLLGLRRRSSR